jgi:NTE family protein
VHERFSSDDRSPFRIFGGVSCGSINAGFFASVSHRAGWASQRLVELWEQFHVPQYQKGISELLRQTLYRKLLGQGRNRWSVLDPEPMERLFAAQFLRSRLEEAFRQGTTLGLAMAAKDSTRNLSTWFVDGPRAVAWTRRHAVCRVEPLTHHHMVASCSVPFYFPPVLIGDRWYFDGAVHLERPFSAVISMGATRILGISSALALTDDDRRHHAQPIVSSIESVLRSMLSVYNHDFMRSEAEQIEVLNRFSDMLHPQRATSPAALRQTPFNAVFDDRHDPHDYAPIRVELISPSSSLRSLADDFRRSELGRHRRTVPVGLLFHRDFITELIRLGYRDARKCHHRLASFFASQPAASSRLAAVRERGAAGRLAVTSAQEVAEPAGPVDSRPS